MKVIKNIKVVPNAKKNEVLREGDRLKVRVTAPAVDGKANKALIDMLAEYFNIRRKDVKIIRGEKSREKVVEINA